MKLRVFTINSAREFNNEIDSELYIYCYLLFELQTIPKQAYYAAFCNFAGKANNALLPMLKIEQRTPIYNNDIQIKCRDTHQAL